MCLILSVRKFVVLSPSRFPSVIVCFELAWKSQNIIYDIIYFLKEEKKNLWSFCNLLIHASVHIIVCRTSKHFQACVYNKHFIYINNKYYTFEKPIFHVTCIARRSWEQNCRIMLINPLFRFVILFVLNQWNVSDIYYFHIGYEERNRNWAPIMWLTDFFNIHKRICQIFFFSQWYALKYA